MSSAGDWIFRTFMKAHVGLYRRTGGRLGGKMRGQPILLLTTVGRRSGRSHTRPLMYRDEGGELFVVASAGGSPRHPDWFHNLVANPDVEVQVGAEVKAMRARVAGEDEGEAIFQRFVDELEQFGQYRESAGRQIPVVGLKPGS